MIAVSVPRSGKTRVNESLCAFSDSTPFGNHLYIHMMSLLGSPVQWPQVCLPGTCREEICVSQTRMFFRDKTGSLLGLGGGGRLKPFLAYLSV